MKELKTCRKCREVKVLEAFAFRKDNGTFLATCRACMNLAQKEKRLANIDVRRLKEQAYRAANMETIRSHYKSSEWHKEHYQKNKTAILARHTEYNANNALKIKEQKKSYYEVNRDKILSNSSAYYRANKAAVYARTSSRRAIRLSATPTWVTKEELIKIKMLYKIAHKVSQLTGVKMHVDHIYPLQGNTVCGFHCLSNLQILTAKENLEKGNSFPDIKYLKEPIWL